MGRIPQDRIRRLIESMPRWVRAVLQANGESWLPLYFIFSFDFQYYLVSNTFVIFHYMDEEISYRVYYMYTLSRKKRNM
jgi:hypothetical protein